MSLYDPEADGAFTHDLKIHLDPKISIIELDLYLDARDFAEEAVKQFLNLYEENKE